MFLATLANQLVGSFISILFFCEIGEKVSIIFIQINNDLDRINWYLFSNDKQKMFNIILCFCKESVVLEGFGSIRASRNVFKEVSLLRKFKLLFLLRTSNCLYDFRSFIQHFHFSWCFVNLEKIE